MKTSELTGTALDWAVSVAVENSRRFPIWLDGKPSKLASYSVSWAHAGPLIEREGIELTMPRLITRDKWCATRIEGSSVCEDYGPTPLVAAMRCYVQACFGDEVEIPEEVL